MDKLSSLISVATGMAEVLGTSGEGQIDRGGGKMVSWSFKGQLRGIHWRYIGLSLDQSTGTTGHSVTKSRNGAIEHSMKDLFNKLAAKGLL